MTERTADAIFAKNPWKAVPFEGSHKQRAFERGLVYRLLGLRPAWYLYRRPYLQNAFKEGWRAAKLFDLVHLAGPRRHGSLTWYLANRAAVQAAAAALAHTCSDRKIASPVRVNGQTLYVHEEPLRTLIPLVVLRVLDAVRPEKGWE